MSIANQKTNAKPSGKDISGIRLRSGKVLSNSGVRDDEVKFPCPLNMAVAWPNASSFGTFEASFLCELYDFFAHSFDDDIIKYEQFVRLVKELDERINEVSWTLQDISQELKAGYHKGLTDTVIWALKTNVINYDQYLGLLSRL